MGTKYADDPSIPHDERLFRRINITHVVERDADKTEVSSAAFRDDELSVNLESVMKSACRPPEDALRNSPNDLLMSVTAGVCRDHEQKVGPDPTPEEPAHGYVFGKKSKAIRRALRDVAQVGRSTGTAALQPNPGDEEATGNRRQGRGDAGAGLSLSPSSVVLPPHGRPLGPRMKQHLVVDASRFRYT